jgi:calcium-dependent protein kinase
MDIMLIDFGISKKGKVIYNEDAEDEGKRKYKFRYRFLTQVSTPLYAAPEIVNHSLYTESVDIWGAGVILYLMVFGDIPFQTKREETKEYTVDLHQEFIDHLQKE